MRVSNRWFSLVLLVCLTLGLAGVASAHQSVTLDSVAATDDGNCNLRWEPHYGRVIIGFGMIDEDGIDGGDGLETEVNGVEMLIGVRKYLSQLTGKGDNFSGVFFEGDVALQMVDLEANLNGVTQSERERTYTTVTALAGYKLIAAQNKKSGLTVEVAAGPRWVLGDAFRGYQEDDVAAVALVNLGYTW